MKPARAAGVVKTMGSSKLIAAGVAVVWAMTAAAAELAPEHTKLLRKARDGAPALWLTSTGGTSMLPTLPLERTPIVYEVVSFTELRKGDIVIYYQAGMNGATIHRVFKRISMVGEGRSQQTAGCRLRDAGEFCWARDHGYSLGRPIPIGSATGRPTRRR